MKKKRELEFKTVLVIPHVYKHGTREIVVRMARWFKKNGIGYFMMPEDLKTLDLDVPSIAEGDLRVSIDLVVVVGGDGTMLHAVDVLWEKDVPIVGINIGKLGFLTAAEEHQIDKALGEIFAGRYWVSERVPVGCTMDSGEYHALNEIVIGKLARERLIHLSTYINGEFFMKYSGDGLIFSSATGSTAYSLSSGGPIVTPDLKCFLLTPICAHMLFSRPMVLSERDRVTVAIDEKTERLALSIDGRQDIEVQPGARLEFFASDKVVKIVELPGNSFYQTLRNKFLGPSSHYLE